MWELSREPSLPGWCTLVPMTSLEDAFSEDEVRAWYRRAQRLLPQDVHSMFVVEPKIDGLAVALTYEEGLLVRGASEEMAAWARTSRPMCAPFATSHCAYQ